MFSCFGGGTVSRQPCSNLGMATRRTWLEACRSSMRRWLSLSASRPASDIDEVAQEVFLRLLRYNDDALADSPQDHLFRIAASVTSEWQDRQGGSAMDEVSPLNGKVREAVANLSQQQREALLLHVNDDLTYKQVALRMRLAPSVAQRDIVSAYVNLRYELIPLNRK